LAVMLSIIAGLTIWQYPDKNWPLLLLPVILLLRMALNAIDGMLAKEHQMASKLGAILNELGDVFSDAALYLPLLFIPGVSDLPVYLFVFLAAASEMSGVLGIQIGASRRYDGPMGKSDRALIISLFCLLAGLNVISKTYLNPILVFVNILLVITIFNRCRKALKEAA
ncbi:MAG: CDP-alcohol phosphatidyltransferase family protein, partial [Calditrichota bacterium]